EQQVEEGHDDQLGDTYAALEDEPEDVLAGNLEQLPQRRGRLRPVLADQGEDTLLVLRPAVAERQRLAVDEQRQGEGRHQGGGEQRQVRQPPGETQSHQGLGGGARREEQEHGQEERLEDRAEVGHGEPDREQRQDDQRRPARVHLRPGRLLRGGFNRRHGAPP